MSHVLREQKRKKGFFDFFPAPHFLFLTTVGVSLSDKELHLIEFRQSTHAGELVLSEWNEQPLPPGAISAGYINDIPAVVKAISELRKKNPFSYVRATLPEEKAYLFTVEVEKEPFESLRDRVAFTIEENVPVTLAKSVFDFDIIGETKGRSTIKVAVCVLPTKSVAFYTQIFQDAGATPISFDVESQAIGRAVIPAGDRRTHLIINIGEEKTGLYVVEDEVVQFSSTPPYGTRSDESGYTDLLSLKAEIRKVFAFWNTRLDKEGIPEKKIEKVLLTGAEAKKDDFINELMADIDVPYALANVWSNAFSVEEYPPDIPYDESLRYAAAIGAALPKKEPRYV
ncbi:MAG: pilus assembly protein PilM [Patescibacteria group bacterium]